MLTLIALLLSLVGGAFAVLGPINILEADYGNGILFAVMGGFFCLPAFIGGLVSPGKLFYRLLPYGFLLYFLAMAGLGIFDMFHEDWVMGFSHLSMGGPSLIAGSILMARQRVGQAIGDRPKAKVRTDVVKTLVAHNQALSFVELAAITRANEEVLAEALHDLMKTGEVLENFDIHEEQFIYSRPGLGAESRPKSAGEQEANQRILAATSIADRLKARK